MEHRSVYRSPEGKAKILAYYNGILSFIPYSRQTVDTSYGKTFILHAGTPSHPPLFLLHGSCSNCASWLADIPALSSRYYVCAIDIPGEPGNSEDNRLNLEGDDYALWLFEVMDALGLPKAVIAGNSLGGWLALRFAALFPARVNALVLLAPSGIIAPKTSFLEQTANIAERPNEAKNVRDTVLGDAPVPKEVLEFLNLIGEHFFPVAGALSVLSDNEMRALTMPILYIAGINDVAIDSKKAAERLHELVPHAKILLTDGAHAITSASNDILPFLAMVFPS